MTESDWPVHTSTTEYDCEWFTVGFDQLKRPDGTPARYYWIEPSDAVFIVAITDDQVVLVEQYRPRQQETFLSYSVGGVEPTESFTAAGIRDLREETGFEAGHTQLLQTYYSAGWLRQERAVLFADDLTPCEQELDEGEFLRVRTLPIQEALATARTAPANGWPLLLLLLADRDGLL